MSYYTYIILNYVYECMCLWNIEEGILLPGAGVKGH